jgi:hypothetical protein
MMFSKDYLQQIQNQYIMSISEDLDGALFNKLLDDDNLNTIKAVFDVDEYFRAERKCLKENRGNDEAYKEAVIYYICGKLQ